jgi:predicted amidohydrolase YtcJ
MNVPFDVAPFDARADRIITGGSVRTLDDAGTVAEALAIAGGRIVAVGSAREIDRLRGPRTKVTVLRGETVLPGFQDAHAHPLHAGRDLSLCNLHDVEADAGAYVRAIADYARAHPDEAWIAGGGWAIAAFANGTPSRALLDAAVPDRPVVLANRDVHGAWANSRALAAAGITADTPDPADGRIEREADGSPQGTLHEGSMKMVLDLVPPLSHARWEEALLAAQAYLHSCGITAVTDAWVEEHQVAPYRALAADGRLTIRTDLALWWDRAAGLEQLEWFEAAHRAAAAPRLRATQVKLMLDGVLENFTGVMIEPYFDATGAPTANRGIPFIAHDQLVREIAPALDRAGFALHFHAIGDGAVRTALDGVAAAARANGPRDRRAHVAHVQVIHPDDIGRFATLDVAANIQTYWACHEAQMDELTIPFLGPERTTWQYPFASLARAGARLAGGSDWAVSTPNVLQEVEVAVRRVSPETRDLPPFLPDQALTLEEGLRAYTRGSAWVHRLDHETGILAPGYLADVCVLDRDIFDPGIGPIGDARVMLTVVEGDAVFEAGGSGAAGGAA